MSAAWAGARAAAPCTCSLTPVDHVDAVHRGMAGSVPARPCLSTTAHPPRRSCIFDPTLLFDHPAHPQRGETYARRTASHASHGGATSDAHRQHRPRPDRHRPARPGVDARAHFRAQSRSSSTNYPEHDGFDEAVEVPKAIKPAQRAQGGRHRHHRRPHRRRAWAATSPASSGSTPRRTSTSWPRPGSTPTTTCPTTCTSEARTQSWTVRSRWSRCSSTTSPTGIAGTARQGRRSSSAPPTSPGVTPGVERVLRAVAQAHRATGAPITTHSHARDQARARAAGHLRVGGGRPEPGGDRPLGRHRPTSTYLEELMARGLVHRHGPLRDRRRSCPSRSGWPRWPPCASAVTPTRWCCPMTPRVTSTGCRMDQLPVVTAQLELPAHQPRRHPGPEGAGRHRRADRPDAGRQSPAVLREPARRLLSRGMPRLVLWDVDGTLMRAGEIGARLRPGDHGHPRGPGHRAGRR